MTSVNLRKMGLTTRNIETLSFLIKTKADYNEFITKFWQGKNDQFFSIAKYRSYKISQKNVSYTTFIREFDVNPHIALENLFQHRIESPELELFIENLQNRSITLQELYDQFKANPSSYFVRHLLSV